MHFIYFTEPCSCNAVKELIQARNWLCHQTDSIVSSFSLDSSHISSQTLWRTGRTNHMQDENRSVTYVEKANTSIRIGFLIILSWLLVFWCSTSLNVFFINMCPLCTAIWFTNCQLFIWTKIICMCTTVYNRCNWRSAQ